MVDLNIVALCEALGIPEFINSALTSDTGSPLEVSYGVLTMMIDLEVFLTSLMKLAAEKYSLRLQLKQ